jgi:hypothetical protein
MSEKDTVQLVVDIQSVRIEIPKEDQGNIFEIHRLAKIELDKRTTGDFVEFYEEVDE